MHREPPEVAGYQVERLLGAGSRAVVWLVRRSTTNTQPTHGAPQVCALKVLREPSDSVLDAQMMSEELHAMSELFHEHVVRVYGSIETSYGPGLLLEAYTAGSLGRLLSSAGSLPVAQCVTAITPIAQALAHIHRAGAVHGDVSPGNILLTPDGRPALGDLGDAQLLGRSHSLRGTQGFMAPERHWAAAEQTTAQRSRRGGQRRGGGQRGVPAPDWAPASDVYSLAAVTWFALTGEIPAAAKHRAPLKLHCPQASAVLAELLDEALHPDPECRPTAAEFAYGLFRSATPEPLDLAPHVPDEVVPELPTSMPVRAKGSLRLSRPPRRVLTATAGAALLLSGLGWWSMTKSSVEPATETEATSPALIGASDISENNGAGETHVSPKESGAEPGEGLNRYLKSLGSPDPYEALGGISGLRTAALQSGDKELVSLYTMPASSAEVSDLGLLDRLEENGMIFQGPRMQITPADTAALPDSPYENIVQFDVEVSAEGWELVAQDRRQTGEHDKGADSEMDFSESAPLPSRQTVSFTLQRTEGRWLLSQVSEPAPER